MFLSRLPRAACSWIQCFCWSNYNPWARPIQRHYPKVLANLYIARDDLQFAMVEKRSLTQKGCVCLLVLCWTFTSCNHLPWDNQLTRNFLMYIYIGIYMYLYLYNYMYSYNYRRVWYIYMQKLISGCFGRKGSGISSWVAGRLWLGPHKMKNPRCGETETLDQIPWLLEAEHAGHGTIA